MSLENVLLSGFHDSIGLYEEATLIQINTARQWLAGLGFLDYTKTCFADLPYGDQRLLLVARAAIKTPELLILDEACQGLERSVRRRVLEFVDRLAASGETTVLSITHDPDEYLACTRQTLSLSPNGLGAPPSWRLSIGREHNGD
jgi:molybdate transport system ATP-binding protein